LYDNNGSMISKADGNGTTQFAWDFENRLTQVVTPASGSITYKYDALGRRIQSAPASGPFTKFTYDGQDVVQDKTSTNVTTEYTNGLGIDDKVRQKTGNTVYYFAKDHLGSTTALTDSKGALLERQTYDAYGNSTGSTRTRYGFTGRERDSLTGLLYYRARFYDPQVGRFISEDPIGLSGGVNAFAYVENSPLNYRDPRGLWPSAILEVHQQITRRVLTGRTTPQQLQLLMQEQRDFDNNTQDEVYAYMHAMRMRGENREDARRKANRFIRQQICLARRLAATVISMFGRLIHRGSEHVGSS
jgi:RHS repeat-associated protein